MTANQPHGAGLAFDAERLDQTRMITFITPVVPFGTLWLRTVFAVTRRFPSITRIARMNVVHFTFWSVLTSIPYNGPPQVRERPSRPYLIWASMYNGEVDPYIEAFVAAVRPQIWATWRPSYNYPGTKSVTKLRNYIVAASWPGSYAYSAYPEGTVRTIAAAFEIEKEHRFLSALAEHARPEEFRTAYDGFLRRCESLL